MTNAHDMNHAHPARPTVDRRTAAAWLAAGLLAGCAGGPPVVPATPPRPSRMSDEQAQDATVLALGLVGTTYRYGGNTPEGGFDCSGLIMYVYRAAGLATPRTVREMSLWGQPVHPSFVRTGDLAIFGSRGDASHAGILVGQGRFVHAPSTGGTVSLARLAEGYWSSRLIGYRRPL
ncbi:C40 family peptidase [Aquincola sp. J276]|nr:C40 family peptidase [Aquincola sp. J276]MCR5864698.1 C40 family peptidase [Aquincola sp. J276]